MDQEDRYHNTALRTELDAYYAKLYGLNRKATGSHLHMSLIRVKNKAWCQA